MRSWMALGVAPVWTFVSCMYRGGWKGRRKVGGDVDGEMVGESEREEGTYRRRVEREIRDRRLWRTGW